MLAGRVALLFLLFWILVVSLAWVQIAADAYAARLVETLERLEAKPKARSRGRLARDEQYGVTTTMAMLSGA